VKGLDKGLAWSALKGGNSEGASNSTWFLAQRLASGLLSQM